MADEGKEETRNGMKDGVTTLFHRPNPPEPFPTLYFK